MPLVKKCRHAKKAWNRCGCAWLADLRVDGKRRYVNLGRNLVDARREYRVLEQRLSSGTVTVHDKHVLAFDALAERWVSQHAQRVGPNTLSGYRSALAHATRWLGDTDARAITAALLADMEGDLLASGLSPSFVRQVRIVTGQVLGYALDLGLIDEVPNMRRHRIERRHVEPRHLEPREVEAVLANLVEPYRAMTEFAWLTGMRPGEVVGLEGWDLVGETMRVARTVHSRTGVVGPTKTRQTRRVDLSPRALAALERIPAVEPNERIFDRSYTAWLRYFHDALARAGVEQAGLHSLRHSNVALRIAAGQDLIYIADQLGHATAAFTLRAYGHLLKRPESQAKMLDAMAAQLAPSPARAEGEPPPA